MIFTASDAYTSLSLLLLRCKGVQKVNSFSCLNLPDTSPKWSGGHGGHRPVQKIWNSHFSPGCGLSCQSCCSFPEKKIVPCDDKSNEQMQYWPFAMSELYSWKIQNTSFSENPRPLNYILDSVKFTHQPPWDDGQKLLDSFYYGKKRDKSDRNLKIGCGIWWKHNCQHWLNRTRLLPDSC